jgi:hypothetical protein
MKNLLYRKSILRLVFHSTLFLSVLTFSVNVVSNATHHKSNSQTEIVCAAVKHKKGILFSAFVTKQHNNNVIFYQSTVDELLTSHAGLLQIKFITYTKVFQSTSHAKNEHGLTFMPRCSLSDLASLSNG